MVGFTSRPVQYKVGLLLLALGFVLYVIGFATPYWGMYTVRSASGAHFTCHEGILQAVHVYVADLRDVTEEWSIQRSGEVSMRIVQGLQSVGLLGLLAAGGYAIAANFIQNRPRFTRVLEITTAASCLLGFVGGVLYVAELGANLKLYSVREELGYTFKLDVYHYAWSLWVSFVGCACLLVASIFIFVYNEDSASAVRPETGVGFSVSGDEGSDHPGVYSVPGQPVLPPAYDPSAPPAYYPDSSCPVLCQPYSLPPEYNQGSANPVFYPDSSDPAYDEQPPEYVPVDGDDKAMLV